MEIRAGEKKSYARVPTRFTRFTLATLAILVTPATAGTLGPAPWPSPHSPRTLPLLCPASKPLSRPLTLVPHHQPQSSRSLISTRFAPSAPNSAPLSPTPSPLPALPTSGVVHLHATCLSRCIYGIGLEWQSESTVHPMLPAQRSLPLFLAAALLCAAPAAGGGYLQKLAAASKEAFTWGWDDYVRWGVQPGKRTDYLTHSVVFSQDDIDSATGYNVRVVMLRRDVCICARGICTRGVCICVYRYTPRTIGQ